MGGNGESAPGLYTEESIRPDMFADCQLVLKDCVTELTSYNYKSNGFHAQANTQLRSSFATYGTP